MKCRTTIHTKLKYKDFLAKKEQINSKAYIRSKEIFDASFINDMNHTHWRYVNAQMEYDARNGIEREDEDEFYYVGLDPYNLPPRVKAVRRYDGLCPEIEKLFDSCATIEEEASPEDE